jgi:transcriptional regulator with XRE-family HTH domain
MAHQKVTQVSLGKMLGVSQSSVFEWLKGTSRPTASNRALLAQIAGISETDWLTDAERKAFRDRLRRAGGEAA